ncbi:MAG: GGDEF domain-containing protein [Pseudomonadota bacterium]
MSQNVRQDQRLRLKRFYMSAALYSMWAAMTIGAHFFQMISTPTLHLWITGLGVASTTLAFWVVLSTGYNLRFKDPSLTLFQCTIGLGWLMAFMMIVPEWRDLLISVFLIGLMFGIFQLQARQFMGLAVFAFVGYMGLTAYDLWTGSHLMTPTELIFRAVVVSCLLAWCAYFGNHVGALRARLTARNQSLQELLREVTLLAERDHLTQAYNRRSIIDNLGKLREAAIRYGECFSIVILDIDFFKQVNDRFGHLTGDEILAAVADRIRSELRMLDELSPVVEPRMLGRYGGEEFILILPRTHLSGAEQCAERIRHSTVSHSFHNDMTISVSAGVAAFEAGESIDDLLRRADKGLYAAKANGRNCVHAIAADDNIKAMQSDVVSLADYQQDN